jgi:DNA modification methylase
VKEPSTKNYSRNFGRFVEVIAYYPGGTYNNDLYWSNYTGVYRDTLETKRLFEYQKPTSLIERFIRILSNPGDLIFDPFMGSGSHLVAAKNLGRNYLGIEIDPVTYELAKSRIEGD